MNIGHASTSTPSVYVCTACGTPNLVLHPHVRGSSNYKVSAMGTTVIVEQRRSTRRHEPWWTVVTGYGGRQRHARRPHDATHGITEVWPRGPYDLLNPADWSAPATVLRCGAYQVMGDEDRHPDVEDPVRWCDAVRFDAQVTELSYAHRNVVQATHLLGGESPVVELLKATPDPWGSSRGLGLARWRGLDPMRLVLPSWDPDLGDSR